MRSTFIGLPTSDVAKATEFFTALGFTLNPDASDARTACLVINESTSVMLHSREYFTEFTGSAVVEPGTAAEVTVGITVDARNEVDALTALAVEAGGEDRGAVDLGYMYMRAFRDLDGHRWSVMHFTF